MRARVLIGGRYELGAVLGYGGSGDVFRATDRSLRREVAAIGPRLLEMDDSRRRAFFNVNTREDLERAAAMLGHGPGLVGPYPKV